MIVCLGSLALSHYHHWGNFLVAYLKQQKERHKLFKPIIKNCIISQNDITMHLNSYKFLTITNNANFSLVCTVDPWTMQGLRVSVTQAVENLYSLASVSKGYWFQEPTWILELMMLKSHSQLPVSAVPLCRFNQLQTM